MALPGEGLLALPLEGRLPGAERGVADDQEREASATERPFPVTSSTASALNSRVQAGRVLALGLLE